MYINVQGQNEDCHVLIAIAFVNVLPIILVPHHGHVAPYVCVLTSFLPLV
jgi:hypothetical protein